MLIIPINKDSENNDASGNDQMSAPGPVLINNHLLGAKTTQANAMRL